MSNGPPERYEFFDGIVSHIPGWLNRGAAIRTMDMLEFQEWKGVRGSLCEIGVFQGKYFAILVRHARFAAEVAVGIDTFALASIDAVWQALDPAIGDYRSRVKLVARYSTEFDPAMLLDLLEDRARFVSVDGSHECNDVYCDLVLAEQVLAPGGIIAVDDFINPVAFGVNEAVHRFFAVPRRLVPWALIENKLFLCQPHWSASFRSMLEDKVMRDDDEPHSTVFRSHLKMARHLVEQRLWGHSLLLLP